MDICVMYVLERPIVKNSRSQRCHPAPGPIGSVSLSSCLALQRLVVEFSGHTCASFSLAEPFLTYFSAHAALSPWEGKNALDAAVLAYNNISALRQQLKPTHRVHGIIEGKDWAPNSEFSKFERVSLSQAYLIQSFLTAQSSCEVLIPSKVLWSNTYCRCYVRAPTRAEMQETLQRVLPCFQ